MLHFFCKCQKKNIKIKNWKQNIILFKKKNKQILNDILLNNISKIFLINLV